MGHIVRNFCEKSGKNESGNSELEENWNSKKKGGGLQTAVGRDRAELRSLGLQDTSTSGD